MADSCLASNKIYSEADFSVSGLPSWNEVFSLPTVQVVGSKLYTRPFELVSFRRERRGVCVCVCVWGWGGGVVTTSHSQTIITTDTFSHRTRSTFFQKERESVYVSRHTHTHSHTHKGTYSYHGAQTNKSSLTIHTPTLTPTPSPSLSSQQLNKVEAQQCVQREMTPGTCGTAMYYNGRRPRASSTSI